MALDMVNPRQHLSKLLVQSYANHTSLHGGGYRRRVTVHQAMDIILCSFVHLTVILFTYTEHCRLLSRCWRLIWSPLYCTTPNNCFVPSVATSSLHVAVGLSTAIALLNQYSGRRPHASLRLLQRAQNRKLEWALATIRHEFLMHPTPISGRPIIATNRAPFLSGLKVSSTSVSTQSSFSTVPTICLYICWLCVLKEILYIFSYHKES
jgi:hypothetical protein